MTAPAHWHDRPIPWDALYITGHLAPGIVDDITVNREYKTDEKDGAGVNGASLTVQGVKLAKVSIKLKMWTRSHLQKIEQLIYSIFIKPKQTKKVTPFDFTHPILQMHGLRALQVVSVAGPTQPSDDGLQFVTLSCIEFAPPPPKPKASQSATTTPTATGLVTLPAWSSSDEKLLAQLEADRGVKLFAGLDTKQIDERIFNLKARKNAPTQAAAPTPPKGPGAGTPTP